MNDIDKTIEATKSIMISTEMSYEMYSACDKATCLWCDIMS